GNLLDVVRQLAAARQTASRIEHADRLQKVCVWVAQLQHNHATGWPRLDPVNLQELRASVARGESLEITDAFAEIAGVTREEWLRRVEEYKAKFPHRRWRETGS